MLIWRQCNNMKPIVQRIARQSGFLAWLLFIFALVCWLEVGKGCWQGSGLHGYIIEPGAKGGSPHIISVWTMFVQALALTGCSGLFACIFWWHRQNEPQVNNSAEKYPPPKRRKQIRTQQQKRP